MFNIKDLNKNYIKTMMKNQLHQTNKRTNQVRQENFDSYIESINKKDNQVEPTFRTRDVYSPTERLHNTFGRVRTEEEVMDTELYDIIRELDNEL